MLASKPTQTTEENNGTGLIGHAPTLDFLRRARQQQRLAHAFLFVGPEHVGKMTMARLFSAELLGADINQLDRHPDFFCIERGRDQKTGKLHGSIVLEQIHELCGRLSMGAFCGGWKICVLDGAHLLHKEAANALLKNLEEPWNKTALILLANDADNVLPTIHSRCQILRMSRVPKAVISAALAGRGCDENKAAALAKIAGGCPGKAVRYAEDAAALENMHSLRDSLLDAASRGIADRFSAVDILLPAKTSFQESRERAGEILDLLGELLRDALILRLGAGDIAHGDRKDRLAELSARLPARRLRDACEQIFFAKQLLDENVNPRSALENVMLFL